MFSNRVKSVEKNPGKFEEKYFFWENRLKQIDQMIPEFVHKARFFNKNQG